MYLISVYFDENTDTALRRIIKRIAKQCGNNYMLSGNVPPHISISAFEGGNEKDILTLLDSYVKDLSKGDVQLASVGYFPGVIFLSAVLNQYLQEMSVEIYGLLSEKTDVRISKFYRPFQWLPHATMGKKLSQREMQEAFQVLYQEFRMIKAQVVKIGLAKNNPYHNLIEWELQ